MTRANVLAERLGVVAGLAVLVGVAVVAMTPDPVLPPYTPCDVNVVNVSPSQQDLSWTAGIRGIGGVTLSAGVLSWTVEPRAASYDVIRGVIAELPVGGGPSDTCSGFGITTTSLAVATNPPADTGYWYLVRGRNACGSGTWGVGSMAERLATACGG